MSGLPLNAYWYIQKISCLSLLCKGRKPRCQYPCCLSHTWDDHTTSEKFKYTYNQGGRTWQPFVGGKNGNENFLFLFYFILFLFSKVNVLALINPSSCSMFMLPIITENKFLLWAQNMVPILCTEHLLYYITRSSKDECRTDVLSSIIYLKSTDHLDQ